MLVVNLFAVLSEFLQFCLLISNNILRWRQIALCVLLVLKLWAAAALIIGLKIMAFCWLNY